MTTVRDTVKTYVANHPDAGAMEVLARVNTDAELDELREIIHSVTGQQAGGCSPEHFNTEDNGNGNSNDNDNDREPDHENPIDVGDVSDEGRAAMLREYLEAFTAEFGQVPRLMPLDEAGKAPIIQGRCRLDSPEGREYLVDGREAIRQIREEGARGFAIYAGKWDHGTDDVVFVDHDDDRFDCPTGDPTLKILSGSGRGNHETYRNDPDDPVANARVGDNLGEIRAENWYVVVPGSVHPSGGVYHVVDDRDVATLSDADLTDEMRPASRSNEDRERTAPDREPEDLDGVGDRPEDDTTDERLQRAFENDHDGDRIEAVWNGRYASAGFDDRSAAEFWLANRLDAWVALGDEQTVRQLMNRANLQKWPERRDDAYRDSVCSEVGYQDWYYDPEYRTEAGEDPAETTAYGQWPVETCTPPQVDRVERDAEGYWDHLQGARYDAVVDADAPVAWADDPGTGKTTNAAIAAAQRDRPHAALFDKHQKAREFLQDDATPDDYFHLKGGAQKRAAHCMDADHADEPCPEHGSTSACPHMCPIYDLPPDHHLREQYEALVTERGPVEAHRMLGEELPGHDDDGRCAWLDQFDTLEGEPRVVGVHEYQTLKTVRQLGNGTRRDVLIDESPDTLKRSRRVTVEDLARAGNALSNIADTPGTADGLGEFARFARDLVDALTDPDRPDALGDLDAPVVDADTIQRRVDPDDLPADVAAEDVERRIVREQRGMPEEAAYERVERHVVESSMLDEALAQAKLAYNETIVARMRDDEWSGTPLVFDALLAAAARAGLDDAACRTAIAVPTVLDHCPWCGSETDYHDGARVCTDDGCDWHEAEHAVTQADSERARGRAELLTGGDRADDVLLYEALPLVTDLPDAPCIMDATATPAKIAGLYGVARDAVRVDGDQPQVANVHTTQVLDGQYHASTIKDTDSLQERIQSAIDTIATAHERVLFVAKQSLQHLFDFPDGHDVLHYHAARGLNFDGCDAVVCIGAPHPRVDDLRRDAELLAMDHPDLRVGGGEHSTRQDAPNPPVYRTLDYADDQGRGRAVPTKRYTGLVGDLFVEGRRKELTQVVHRSRPVLAEETQAAYLLTNVPTDLRVDQVATFDELTEPVRALLDVREGALDLARHIDRAARGDVDGFRAGQLVDHLDGAALDGAALRINRRAAYRLARLQGLDVSRRTIYRWVDDLERVGVLRPQTYEQRAGVPYETDLATLTSALTVLSSNGGVKVGVQRRFRQIVAAADSFGEWLDAARQLFAIDITHEDAVDPPGGRLDTPAPE